MNNTSYLLVAMASANIYGFIKYFVHYQILCLGDIKMNRKVNRNHGIFLAILAAALIAFLFFRESISLRLWLGILFVTAYRA